MRLAYDVSVIRQSSCNNERRVSETVHEPSTFTSYFILPRWALWRHIKREDWNKARIKTMQSIPCTKRYYYSFFPPFACLTLLFCFNLLSCLVCREPLVCLCYLNVKHPDCRPARDGDQVHLISETSRHVLILFVQSNCIFISITTRLTKVWMSLACKGTVAFFLLFFVHGNSIINQYIQQTDI